MKQHRKVGEFKDNKKKVVFDLVVLSYLENDLHVIYAPSIDLFGYGSTESEANESFKITLEEFIRYTSNKGTLNLVLKQLGWEVKPRKFYFKSPPLAYMLNENEQFNEIFNHKDFSKFNHQVEIAVSA